MKHDKKRKYYRKCGECGKRCEQSDMVRTNESTNGWLCRQCFDEMLEEIEFSNYVEDF